MFKEAQVVSLRSVQECEIIYVLHEYMYIYIYISSCLCVSEQMIIIYDS